MNYGMLIQNLLQLIIHNGIYLLNKILDSQKYKFLCSYYKMECDNKYINEIYTYTINKNVEYKGNYNRSDVAIEYENYIEDKRCGAQYCNIKCNYNKCCSKYGYYGESKKYCDSDNGCQFEFGNCIQYNNKNNNLIISIPFSIKESLNKTLIYYKNITEILAITEISITTKIKYSKYYNECLGENYYFGVNELKNFNLIKAKYCGNNKSLSKYINCLIKNENNPLYICI
ncbi:hypothetical protein BCR36DRAFT_416847 [Piromyces finnis]|uniref:Chitin-binding type-1 domain-containing protein n=1 Tax=Piromyces finnis TaxID=1754191 RepID=A0A1Y1UTJ6_9FUNG|nr:hypothetical protein BCR36DRAFT_416847 [Piromyces finnis]|eukprot:ORX41343.1 hypothetical protein BCR36DRAFT_416847 [Piromyces finnis]